MDHYTRTGKNDSRGFTLAELAVVIIIMGILVAIAIPMYQGSVRRAKETTLKANLAHLRDAIDQFTADKKYPPPTLEDIVSAGYFRIVPIDPITGSPNTWQLLIDVSPISQSSQDTGIVDVHSGSIESSWSDGTPYSTW